MRENKPQEHSSERSYSCEFNHLFGGAPCARAGEEIIDGLLLCERHALEAKLEGQIECWGGLLSHIDLWSREASRRGRADIVGLLEVQRVEATSARHRAYADLDVLRIDTQWEHREPLARRLTRNSLLLLPPVEKGARPLSRGLRRLRRR